MQVFINIQQECLDTALLDAKVAQSSSKIGAVVSFSGLVRDFNENGAIKGLEIEHYPGMTEKALSTIVKEAADRWEILAVGVAHRVGIIANSEVIVHVSVASQHRKSAFAACEFIMDFLKTDAPFWKKELSEKGDYWVEAKKSDAVARERW
ncbi:MAG: molybdenum cofactor biosynthesis protein MoaE [Gammaproteobacteria bacterium]|nr:MAG: molybdenum cofactor biosynthesis protein MoaE [Gammaproteobacteria bacterium]